MRLGILGKCVIGSSVVMGGYGFYSFKLRKKGPVPATGPEYVLSQIPDVKPSHSLKFSDDQGKLMITLFQYQTCPFCSKVRSLLDYYGLQHDIVEVNPVLRNQIKWSQYKKVPLLIASDGRTHQQLNDSSLIVSVLYSHLVDPETSIGQLVKCYPSMETKDNEGNLKYDLLNKYHVMYGSRDPGRSESDIVEERQWRRWSDDVLVHMLSPNVYRTPSEALQTFHWFSEVGRWRELFPSWERQLVIYVGAAAMYLIGKSLKRRHNLKDNVRESLYDACNVWLKQLRQQKTKFHGGAAPDLADLAVYGTLSSIEGCHAFVDLLNNTRLGEWYSSMQTAVSQHEGRTLLKRQRSNS